MKLNEITIGDLVMVKHAHREPSAERIEGVGRDVVLIKTESGMQSFGYDKVSPIPLTTEILELNGFKHKQDWSYSGRDFYAFPANRVLEYKGFGVEYVNNELFYITDHQLMPFMYVHEFQQILRLCGLNEIADNFKVK